MSENLRLSNQGKNQRRSGKSTPREDQNFLCGQCGKGYKWVENLNRHQRLECGKLPKHQCHICGKRFYRRYELTKHNVIKHGPTNPVV